MASHDASKIKPADLTEAQAKAELARLAAEIGAHDKRYYQQDKPSVTDAAYDALRTRRQVQESPPRGTDAVARQRVRGAGRYRFRRPHPPLPQTERRRKDHVQR